MDITLQKTKNKLRGKDFILSTNNGRVLLLALIHPIRLAQRNIEYSNVPFVGGVELG